MTIARDWTLWGAVVWTHEYLAIFIAKHVSMVEHETRRRGLSWEQL